MKVIVPVVVAGMAVLSGCTGTSTYGTGKTQEAQLIEDLTGLAMLGGKKKKPRIDYSARPELVKPPKVASLAAPVEENSQEEGYFPVDPEKRRALIISNADKPHERSGDIAVEDINKQRRVAGVSSENAIQRPTLGDVTFDRDASAEEMRRESVEGRQERLAARKEARGILGAQPRKYLSQPPSEYRAPAQTAAVGEVGEKEVDPTKKPKKGLFDFLKRDSKDDVN